MIGPILGSAAGIIQAIMGQQAQQESMDLARQNLEFQQANADRQFNLATATRPDVFGNETSFDALNNEWDISLAPQQQAIIDAFQMEQQKSLTEDAARARSLRGRQEDRSKAATRPYQEAVAEYLYSPNQPGEVGEYVSDAQTEAAIARREAGRQRADTSRTGMIRAGQGGDIEKIFKQADTVSADKMVEDILRSKQAGRQAYGMEKTNWENIFRPKINMFGQIMDDIGGADRINPDTPQRMDAQQRSMLEAMGNAMTNESSQVGNAFSNMSTIAGNGGLDLTGLISALSGIGRGDSAPKFGATVMDPLYSPTPSMSDRIEGPRNPDYMGY